MKKYFFALLLIFGILSLDYVGSAQTGLGTSPAIAVKKLPITGAGFHNIKSSDYRPAAVLLARQPLLFIENDGQLNEKVKFYEKGSRHATCFCEDGIYLTLSRPDISTQVVDSPDKKKQSPTLQDRVKLSFVDGALKPAISAEDLLPTKYNYYIGNDPAKWRENISTYRIVKYTELYKNIDLKVYGNEHQLEYDIIVKPGADPKQVKFRYDGAHSLVINQQGELEITLDNGSIIQKAPHLYQKIGDSKKIVSGRFKLLSDNTYTFNIAAYDRDRFLIIDPVIEYAKYLAGDWTDYGNAVAVDADGNAYVTGKTDSTYFPFDTTAFQHDVATYKNDIFVYKTDPYGTLLYVTVFGGTANDVTQSSIIEEGNGIAVDSYGNAHIVGSTMSDDFPTTTGAFQEDFVGWKSDACYTVFDSNGNMVYSSYFGGINTDYGNTIAVADSGTVYIAGNTAPYGTHSADFPVLDALQPALSGVSDGFIAKIDFDATTPTNTSLVFATYFGGNGGDGIAGIALDDVENIYITGTTDSVDLPGASLSPIQPTFAGTYDAFVAKINVAGTNIVYATYLGGIRTDIGKAIAVDPWGEACVAGDLMPPSSGGYDSFPLVNAIQSSPGGGQYDVFAAKINAGGTAIVYSTFLGGTLNDKARDIAVDSQGSAFVAGETWSADFPIENPITGHNVILGDTSNKMDGFITRFSPLGSCFIYSTFLGGNGDNVVGNDNAGTDSIHGIVVNDNGNAWVTGTTTSHSFPGSLNSYDNIADGFIAKISDDSPIPPEIYSVSPPADSTDVLVSSRISATFSRDMNTDTFSGNMSIVATGSEVPVDGTVGNNGWHVIEFIPASDLAEGTTYTATINTGAADTAGTNLPADYSWEFTTKSAGPDTTPPTIASDPTQYATGIPVDAVLTFTFDANMDPDTLNADTVAVYYFVPSYTIIDGTYSYNAETRTLTFIPSASLPTGTGIMILFSKNIADTEGRHVCYSENDPLYVYFSTEDIDGVADLEEQGPDGDNPNYDGNLDSYPDWTQANVTSLHTEDGAKYVTLSCPPGQFMKNVSAITNPSSGDTPGGTSFPFGFFDFTITGLEAGGATTLTINLSEGETVNSYWKYGPTPDNPTDHWYDFMYDDITGTGAVITNNQIVLHFVDGQRGDDTLTSDTKIIEPGAPALIELAGDFDDDLDVDGKDLAYVATHPSTCDLSQMAGEFGSIFSP